MANRVRTERLEIKLTKEEKELFQTKMRQAKCKSMNHFLRKCVLEKEIYTVDLKPFNELQGLLANATNNINQIARQLNQSKSEVAEEEWLAVKEQLEGLDREVAEVWQRLR